MAATIDRTAKYQLQGFIAARTAEAGQKTANAISRICKVIMEAYRVANEVQYSRDEKVASVRQAADLLPDLEWLVEFTRDEAQNCKVPTQRLQLTEKHTVVYSKVNLLKQEFRTLRQSIENFPTVFDLVLAVLDTMTGFMESGTGAGVANAGDVGKAAAAEAQALASVEFVNVLVTQAKQTSTRINEFIQSVENLISIQDSPLKEQLTAELNVADNSVRTALQDLIMKTKNVFTGAGTKDAQARAATALTNELKKVQAVLDKIQANYSNSFDVVDQRRKAALQMGMPVVEEPNNKFTGDLLAAARAMAEAMSKMNNIMDVPEEPKYRGPVLAAIIPEQRSAKGDLIIAAQNMHGAMSNMTTKLQQ
jgi:hypothetical protein